MTPNEYIEYIDRLIEKGQKSIRVAKHWGDPTYAHDIELETLNDLKNKFLTIEYPPKETENNFTDNL